MGQKPQGDAIWGNSRFFFFSRKKTVNMRYSESFDWSVPRINKQAQPMSIWHSI